jgi:LPXTG-motif cell wall-anchored protein
MTMQVGKFLRFVAASGLAISAASAVANIAQAAPPSGSDKVEICHRTHSVTNPYVRITVAQRSVGNGNGKHGGNSHDQYSTVLFPSGKPNPNVFNPAVTYSPAPEKKWGDIIAFTDVSGNALTGNAFQVRGLNNTGIGAQIFQGTGAYAGLCKTMTPRDYYEVQVIEGGQSPSSVLTEMDEFDADEFSTALTACNGTFATCNAGALGSPTAAAPTTTAAPATTVAPATTAGATATTVRAGATATTVAATRKLTGKIWIDSNRDGKKDSSEKILANHTVTVKAGAGNTSTQTFTVKTDSAGNYEVADLPAGNWVVTAAAVSDSNYEKVFDSDSGTTSSDWVVAASVPSTGTATADFATALSAAAVAAGATDSLGAVAAAPVAAAPTAKVGTVNLPATGSSSIAPLLWLAFSMLVLGAGLLRRRSA